MNKKWDIQTVRKVFEREGCKLVSDRYQNTSTKLLYIASCGHSHEISLENFLTGKGRICKKCRYEKLSKEKTKPFSEVKKLFEENGCQLLSESYDGCYEKLEYIAQCGHKNCISYAKFAAGGGRLCRKCSKSIRYEYDDVFEAFANEGCLLLEPEYINCKQPLKFIAKCGHESFITFDAFLNSSKSKYCSQCQKISHYTIEKVIELFERQDCKVLDTVYVPKKKIRYLASCGHEHEILLSKFINGQGIQCPKCSRPKGENHFAYNPKLTPEQRLHNRDVYEYICWRKAVFERDGYTCMVCADAKGGNLVAHHLDSYSDNEAERFLLENGVTLCQDCHKRFHGQFGYGRNTKEQFEEYRQQHGNAEVSARMASRPCDTVTRRR